MRGRLVLSNWLVDRVGREIRARMTMNNILQSLALVQLEATLTSVANTKVASLLYKVTHHEYLSHANSMRLHSNHRAYLTSLASHQTNARMYNKVNSTEAPTTPQKLFQHSTHNCIKKQRATTDKCL